MSNLKMLHLFKSNKDYWGIKRAVKEIYEGAITYSRLRSQEERAIIFDAFFYQFVPDIWKASKEAVIRHRNDIKRLAQSDSYKEGSIWIKRNNQLKCVSLNNALLNSLPSWEPPYYSEIEKEKTRWQSDPDYIQEKGRTQGLEEEFIQLRFIKK